jgi:methylthioribose-1-phosphate isomerase
VISPLRFEDGALLMLDQRLLPAEERWLRCRRPEEVAEAIRTLAVRGAPAIGLAAAYGLALAAAEEDDPEAGRRRVEAAAELLACTRPTAANLRFALERGRQELERTAAPATAMLELAHRLHRDQLAADRRLAVHGAERMNPGERVLTHCNTGPLATGGYGTAAGVIRAAHERGLLERAWVTETRPLLQGSRLTAWELRRAGVPFRLLGDSAVGALMQRGLVDRVVVGADRIAASGDVANKVGTYPIAVLAERHGVPLDVAAPLSTLDPETSAGEAIPIEERSPDEVTHVAGRRAAPPGAEAVNPAFDVTPAELVSAIVTEAGVLEPPFSESIVRALGAARAA